jgi:hypothetical protein
VSAVWRGGGGGTFYRAGEVVEGRGDDQRRWSFNAPAVAGDGASGISFQSERGEEVVRRPFRGGGRTERPGGG